MNARVCMVNDSGLGDEDETEYQLVAIVTVNEEVLVDEDVP